MKNFSGKKLEEKKSAWLGAERVWKFESRQNKETWPQLDSHSAGFHSNAATSTK